MAEAQSLGGAVRNWINRGQLVVAHQPVDRPLRAFWRHAPDGTPYPYAVVHTGIGGGGAVQGSPRTRRAGRSVIIEEDGQVDLWQLARNANDEPIEDYTLHDRLAHRLDGAKLQAVEAGVTVSLSPTRTWDLRVLGVREIEDPDPLLVRHVLQLLLKRERLART